VDHNDTGLSDWAIFHVGEIPDYYNHVKTALALRK